MRKQNVKKLCLSRCKKRLAYFLNKKNIAACLLDFFAHGKKIFSFLTEETVHGRVVGNHDLLARIGV
jgi:hypothetical protein